METEKEKELWRLAKKRVGFKRHFAAYLIVNGFFWCIWLMDDDREKENFPWPLWSMLGWGIGVAFDFVGAYITPKNNAVEKEYEKLKTKEESK